MGKTTGRRTGRKAGRKAATKSKKAGARPSPRGNAARKAAGVRGRPFQLGYDPRRNYTKPGSGRPPNEFRHMMGEGVDGATEKVLRALDERDVDDNRFWQALEFAARDLVGPDRLPGGFDAEHSRLRFDLGWHFGRRALLMLGANLDLDGDGRAPNFDGGHGRCLLYW